MKIVSIACFVSLMIAAAASAYEPTSHYTIRDIEGFKVYINNALLDKGAHAEVGAEALKLLESDLATIKTWVADRPLKELFKVPIWLEVDTTNGPHGRTPVFHYHPGLDWLVKMDFHPGKHQCVEFSRASSYVRAGDRAVWTTLHELTHGYHDRVLGYDDPDIAAAYKKAVAGTAYPARDWVRANKEEYFAGVTKRYFQSPEERKLGKERDPDVFKILVRIWGEPKPNAGKPLAKPPADAKDDDRDTGAKTEER